MKEKEEFEESKIRLKTFYEEIIEKGGASRDQKERCLDLASDCANKFAAHERAQMREGIEPSKKLNHLFYNWLMTLIECLKY